MRSMSVRGAGDVKIISRACAAAPGANTILETRDRKTQEDRKTTED